MLAIKSNAMAAFKNYGHREMKRKSTTVGGVEVIMAIFGGSI
jgi:hypothetical protein